MPTLNDQTVLVKGLGYEDAESLALVLEALGIKYRLDQDPEGWRIRVAAKERAAAQQALRQYLSENAPTRPIVDIDPWPYTRSLSGVTVAAGLLLVDWIVGRGDDRVAIVARYAARATEILAGEWYRAATALALHGDAVHLIANCIAIALFGSVVAAMFGIGMGWLAILGSGIGGNMLNAFLAGPGHNSIGASTAVFGAIGIAAAHRFVILRRRAKPMLQAMVPLAAGLGLLAFLGAQAETDVSAHLLGFGVGGLGGLLLTYPLRQPLPKPYQYTATAFAVACLTLAWSAGVPN